MNQQQELNFGAPEKQPAVPDPQPRPGAAPKEAPPAGPGAGGSSAGGAQSPAPPDAGVNGRAAGLPDGPLRNLFDDNFLRYASYVIRDRAIPDVDDAAAAPILHSLKEMDSSCGERGRTPCNTIRTATLI